MKFFSVLYCPVTLVVTVGDANQDITTEQEAAQRETDRRMLMIDQLELLRIKGLVMLLT